VPNIFRIASLCDLFLMLILPSHLVEHQRWDEYPKRDNAAHKYEVCQSTTLGSCRHVIFRPFALSPPLMIFMRPKMALPIEMRHVINIIMPKWLLSRTHSTSHSSLLMAISSRISRRRCFLLRCMPLRTLSAPSPTAVEARWRASEVCPSSTQAACGSSSCWPGGGI
jgi:hypothetical protein